MNGAEHIARALEARGIDTIFGYPGGMIMPLYDALIDSPIRHILCRHEQGAAFAAGGYARASGRPGVCLATSGPGATNLITGIADAHLDSVPLVAITGQVPTALIGTDAFQETDVLGLSLPVTKHSILVRRPGELPAAIGEAFRVATSGRPGPVLVDVPKDILLAEVDAEPWPDAGPAAGVTIAPEAVAAACALLRSSHRPVIYAGGGVTLAGAEAAFRRFVEATGIPTVLTLKGLGNLPDGHPCNLGMLGMHGSVAANRVAQECDLLVVVGARFDDRVTGRLDRFAPHARVVHLDGDAAQVGKLRAADCALVGAIGPALEALAAPLDIEGWRRHCRALHGMEGFAARAGAGPGIDPAAFLRRLAAAVERRAVISCDVGQHQMWVAQYYPFDHPRQHLTSGGLGAMGFGLPSAIGAQLARPDVPVVNVSGDGSFLMNVQELATLKRYGLPVKVVVFDNQRLGMVRQQQELCYDGRYTEVDLSDNPDFTAVAAAFGLPARRVSEAAAVEEAIDWCLRTPGPCLLHVPVAAEANVWPMVKPGHANEEMIRGTVA